MKLRSILALALALVCASPAAAQETRGTSPLSGAKGGTNDSFMQFTGPTSPIKTYTLPNFSDTIDTITAANTLINHNFVGGAAANATETIQSTNNASPSGDVLNLLGSVINLRTVQNSGVSIVNIGNANATSGQLTIAGGASGAVTIVPTSVASGTLTLPNGNDTLVARNSVDTLANKTLTSPVINGPTVTGTAIASAAQYFAGAQNELVQAGVIYEPEVIIPFSATPTFDFSTFINAGITLAGNITTMNVANVIAGKAGTIVFVQDATGSRTVVFNSIFKFAGGATPVLSTAPGSVDVLSYSCRTATFCISSVLLNVR